MDTNFVGIGKQLARGAFGYAGEVFLYGVLILVAVGFLRKAFSVGMDTTDKDKWNRSGLKLMIDNQTGVHYLSDGCGGMHVRVDATGKPVTGK